MTAADVLCTTTMTVTRASGRIEHYWIEVPHGMTNQEAADSQEWHGPFGTEDEAYEASTDFLLEQEGYKLVAIDQWNPALDRSNS
jgi:hypothetical protein